MSTPRCLVLALLLVLLASCAGKKLEEFPVEQELSLGGLKNDKRMRSEWSVNLGENDMVPSQRRVHIDRNQLLVAAADGVILALDANTGKEQWRQDVAVDDIAINYAFRRILISSRSGEVVLLDRDGTQLWRARTDRELLAPPVTDGNVVVVHASSGELIALDLSSGEELWAYKHPQSDLQVRGNSLPVMRDNAIIAGLTTGSVAVHQPVTGVQVSQFQIASSKGGNELQQLVDIDHSPQFWRNLMFVGTYQYQLQALDMQAGAVKWSHDFGTPRGMVIDDEQLITVNEAEDVVLMDAQQGTILWTVNGLDEYDPALPIVTDTAVLVPLVEENKYLVLDRNNGDATGLVSASGSLGGSYVLDGNTLYTIGATGKLTRWSMGF